MSNVNQQQDKTSFVANEPVIVSHFVAWVLVQIGALVVGHTSLVTSTQWNAVTTALVPMISAFVLGVIAVVTRKFVSPFWKNISGSLNKAGLWTPSTAEIDALAEQIYQSFLKKQNADALALAADPTLNNNADAEAINDKILSRVDYQLNQRPANAGAVSEPNSGAGVPPVASPGASVPQP